MHFDIYYMSRKTPSRLFSQKTSQTVILREKQWWSSRVLVIRSRRRYKLRQCNPLRCASPTEQRQCQQNKAPQRLSKMHDYAKSRQVMAAFLLRPSPNAPMMQSPSP